jgi:hypothetical protein
MAGPTESGLPQHILIWASISRFFPKCRFVFLFLSMSHARIDLSEM